MAVVLRLTILEVVTSVSSEPVSAEAVPSEPGRGSGTYRSKLEAKTESEMSSFLDRGGHNLNYISFLASEKLKLGHLCLDFKGVVPELLGVDELILVQDVSGGGCGQRNSEAEDDQVPHFSSVCV